MVVPSTTTGPSDPVRLHAAALQLIRALALAIVAALLLLALWFLSRRLGGQLQQPLSWPALLLVNLALVALVALPRTAWLHLDWRPTAWISARMALWSLPTLAALLAALALSIAGTGAVKLAVLWTTTLAAEAWWWSIAAQPLRRPAGSRRSPPPATATATATGDAPARSTMTWEEGNEERWQLPEDVCQQLTRSWAEEDRDTVVGLLRAQFQPGERSHSLHVAFCPPMLRRPDVAVIQLSGAKARIKPAEIQPFGIRFDMRLVAASKQAENLLVHFEARCGSPENPGPGSLPGD